LLGGGGGSEGGGLLVFMAAIDCRLPSRDFLCKPATTTFSSSLSELPSSFFLNVERLKNETEIV